LADGLMLLSSINSRYDKPQMNSLIEQSTVEIEQQRKLGSKVGPDFYQRLNKKS